MHRTGTAVVALLLSAGLAGAHGTTGRVYYRAYYYPAYTVTSVPVYYYPVACAPAVYAPARPVVLVPNLAVPTAAPPSQTKEPPLAPGKTDKGAASPKAERPPQVGDTSFYLNVSRPQIGPPVVTGES